MTTKPGSGHPNVPVTVAGSGFAAGEAVDVYVDMVDTQLLVTTSTGTFSGTVTIPASAQPGKHYVTAIGRHSGDAANSGFAVTTPWNEQGFGAAHLGWNPYENTLGTSNVGSLGIVWSTQAGGLGGAPVVAGNKVYIGTNAGVEALSAASGAVVWKALTGTYSYASPAISGSTLYVGDSGSAKMYALSISTGATIWSQTTGGAFQGSPVVAGGLVFAGSTDDKVYAFSAATGAIAWTYTTGGFIDSTPAVVNGVLYIGSGDDTVYALDAATGTLNWSYKTGGAVESPPAVSNGVMYIGSDDDKLYAIRAAGPGTGSVLWSYTAGGAIFCAPTVAGGRVYFGSTDGDLDAVDGHTGSLRWAVPTGGIVEAPVVANGVVYATSRNGDLFAVDAAAGTILATGATGYSFLGNPAVSDGVLYLNTYSSGTYALSPLSGVDAVPARAPRPSSLHRDLSLVAMR